MVSEGNCLYHWQQKERYVRIRRVDEYTCAKGMVSNRRDDEWSPGMYAYVGEMNVCREGRDSGRNVFGDQIYAPGMQSKLQGCSREPGNVVYLSKSGMAKNGGLRLNYESAELGSICVPNIW